MYTSLELINQQLCDGFAGKKPNGLEEPWDANSLELR